MPVPSIRGFSPILAVKQLDRSIALYERLGFTARRYEGSASYAFLNGFGLELHLAQSDTAEVDQNPGSGIYFYFHDGTAAALEADFHARGVTIQSPLQRREWGMNEFVIADPDGNLLRFGEPV